MTKKILVIINYIFWQTAGFVLTAFYLIYRLIIPHRKGSHPISKFFRKAFERKKARNNWGISFLIIILLSNFMLSPFSYRPKLGQNSILAAPKNIVTTESTYQKPSKGWLSQGFHWYHQAVDIATNLEEEVYPISKGKVIIVEHTKWGYGHFVVINHENYKSLYAHLGEIKVKPGQEVNKDTLLGYIGMTGKTTGPHLHLEIYGDEGNINPVDIIPGVSPQFVYNK